MANDSMHWFKFFPQEFLSSPEVQALTLAEQGALLRLWCVYFRLRDNLPADLGAVARMAQVPADACAMLMHQHFEQDDDGTWFSPRLQRELDESLKRSQKGKDAAAKRWRKRRNSASGKAQGAGCQGNANPLPPGAHANALPTQCDLDLDADQESDREHPGSDRSRTSVPIHSESGVGGVDVSLLGSDRQTRSYASTSEPTRIADQLGAVVQGMFGRAAQ